MQLIKLTLITHQRVVNSKDNYETAKISMVLPTIGCSLLQEHLIAFITILLCPPPPTILSTVACSFFSTILPLNVAPCQDQFLRKCHKIKPQNAKLDIDK